MRGVALLLILWLPAGDLVQPVRELCQAVHFKCQA